MRDRLIELLDGADLFLRNRANAEPAPLNEYDIEQLKDIAKVCDEAARTLERAIVPPCKVGDTLYLVRQDIQKITEVIVTAIMQRITFQYAEVLIVEENRQNFITLAYWGDRLFPTKEEAEQALSKLQASYEQVKEGVE